MRITRSIRLVLAVLWLAPASSAAADDSDYPVGDPFLATVVGTASEDRAPVPEDVPAKTRRIRRFPERELSKVFWDRSSLRYGVAAQKERAPLVFVVAGTGASYNAQKMTYLEAALWQAGFHVVTIASPTHPDFMLAASVAAMPGYVGADVRDLYEVMKLIHEAERERLDISGFRLTGYSLGGSHAAFLAALDAEEGYFGFERVVLLNPAVDLYTSIGLLDGLFDKGLPEGATSFGDLSTRLMTRVTEYVHSQGRGGLDDELLYHIAEESYARGEPPAERDLYGLIAAAFRISSANMIFTADVMNGGGHVIERGRKLGVGTSLTPALKRAGRWPFVRYLDEMLLPFLKAKEPSLDRDAVIAACSLHSIGTYLEAADHIAALSNEDEIILAPEDLGFLRSTFGERAVIFPHGGHLGNMAHRDYVEAMLKFLSTDGESRL